MNNLPSCVGCVFMNAEKDCTKHSPVLNTVEELVETPIVNLIRKKVIWIYPPARLRCGYYKSISVFPGPAPEIER